MENNVKNLIEFFKKEYNYEYSIHNKQPKYLYYDNQQIFLRTLEKCHKNKYFNISIDNNNLDKKSKLLTQIDENNKIIISYDNTAILYITDYNWGGMLDGGLYKNA